MPNKSMSSRAFNQDTGFAKKAAKRGPVIITERGRPSHVLLTYEDYRKLAEGQRKIGDLLFMPGVAEVEFELPARSDMPRAADFT